MRYPPVTTNTTFNQLARHPAFEGFGKAMMPFKPSLIIAMLTKWQPLSRIARSLPGWDAAMIAGGVNFVIGQIADGIQVYHPLYTPSEIAADPAKAEAGLFFFPGQPGAPFAMVMAGGAFMALASIHEGFPHAKLLHEQGYHVGVLRYRTGIPKGKTKRLARMARAAEDLIRAMQMVRDNASDWNVDFAGYSIWGSSAGGALALQWGSSAPDGAAANGFDKPAAVIAAYPGRGSNTETDAPTPLFVTAAADDMVVPIALTDRLVEARRAHGSVVAYERHERGNHGYGLGSGTPAEGWFTRAVSFWEQHRR